MPPLSRREFAGICLSALVARVDLGPPLRRWPPGARLSFRPPASSGARAAPGPQPLGLSPNRDGVLYVPKGYRPEQAIPLVLTLHGATGSSRGPIQNFGPLADALGLALLVPESRRGTWDAVVQGEFGDDRDLIDQALATACRRIAVDPRRIGVAGFSDGATYALAIGRANGDLFGGVTAFSPGFLIEVDPVGRPPVFISHGVRDSILPIESCSRKIVPVLKQQGYPVTYREFEGDHTVPPDLAGPGLRLAAGLA